MAGDTRAKLLDAAQRLIQSRGYNAFSFKDLSREIGIRTASIHYHFPTKADLALGLMERYLEGLDGVLAVIDGEAEGPVDRLQRFIALYRETESCGSICMCGSLASDRETLSPEVRAQLAAYLERSEGWVAEVIRDGVCSGDFCFFGEPDTAAALLVAGLQGGLVVSRGRADGPRVEALGKQFLQMLQTP